MDVGAHVFANNAQIILNLQEPLSFGFLDSHRVFRYFRFTNEESH